MPLRRLSILLCFSLLIRCSWFLCADVVVSGGIEIKEIKILDSSGGARVPPYFSASENIGFSIVCDNRYSDADVIFFFFEVIGLRGKVVFSHIGNIGAGEIHPGLQKSFIKNIPIKDFYEGSGKYLYKATVLVRRSGKEMTPVTKTMEFYVYSPSLTLSYPPDGARDLVDKPLTFRWVCSGATKFRVYVDDDKGFYNCLFQTGTSEYPDVVTNYFTYPLTPRDPRQKLVGGVVYWWKVEGLDNYGNVVVKTPVPFSFTIKETAPSVCTKDLAVTDITLEKTGDELKFNVSVKNQGGVGVSNARVNLFVNGVPVVPYQVLDLINTGEEKSLAFAGEIGKEKTLLVSAAIDFPDDNLKNNMLTRSFTLGYRFYTPQEVWQIVKRFIKDPAILKELEGYTPIAATLIPEGEIGKELELLEAEKARVIGVEIEVVR